MYPAGIKSTSNKLSLGEEPLTAGSLIEPPAATTPGKAKAACNGSPIAPGIATSFCASSVISAMIELRR